LAQDAQRQAPGVQGDPDESTRLARSSAASRHRLLDPRRACRGAAAHQGLTLKPTVIQAPFWLYFPTSGTRSRPGTTSACGWRPASPSTQDHQPGLTLGHSRITGSIIPDTFDYYWQPPAPVYDPAKAKKLLAEAAIPTASTPATTTATAPTPTSPRRCSTISRRRHSRQAAAARAGGVLQGISREELQEHHPGSQRRLRQCRHPLEASSCKGGTYVYGNYPDIDALSSSRRPSSIAKKREAILHKMQQLVHERTIYAHIWQLAFINGAGPRVGSRGSA
jgi:peptide/nickel transport system substrate-binding protein